MKRVTPVKVTSLTPELLSLSDTAVNAGMARRVGSAYRITFLDDEGTPLMDTIRLSDTLGDIDVAMPEAIRHRDYTIVRVQGERGGKLLPQAMELHLVSEDKVPRVVGVRY